MRWLWLFVLLLLSGCERNSTIKAFDTYIQKLANVLGVDTPRMPEAEWLTLPIKRELEITTPDIRLGLLDAYQLRKCHAFGLIADRNSAMGKVQDEMLRLQYELRLLTKLDQCLPIIDDELKLELQHIKALKQVQIYHHFWNAITLNQEWQQMLRPTTTPFELNNLHGFAATEQMLLLLNQIYSQLEQQQPISDDLIDALVTQQKTIQYLDYIGRLYTSMHLSAHYLQSITQFLTQHDHLIQCGQNTNQQRAQYLRNVLERYYIDTLQPYLADINGQYLELQPLLNGVYTPPSAVSAQFEAYRQAMILGEVHTRFTDAIGAHTRYWQALFNRCEISVGTR
ncbi:DUF3080 family protein [Thaumasiovibrio sp. DFM-14]|uniref:DUF3080 family protein n=1 Tax=Thaumasiovibrio sp. DFM-14 TaxID=3384792 RepID=UPI0039A1DB06